MRKLTVTWASAMVLLTVLLFASHTTQAQEKVLWIDVRSQAEFNAGHVHDALLIPHTIIAAQIAKVAPNKHQRINLYCHSGRRAEIALLTLEMLGYTNVQNLGGFDALTAQGIQ